MKKMHYTVFAPIVGLMITGQAAATVPTAEVKVLGVLEVPGCTVSQDDGSNVYDFKTLASSLVKPGTATNTLTDRAIEKTWTIACTGMTYLTYKVTDNRQASSSIADISNFGLGNVNATGKIGYYEVTMSNATVDINGATGVPTRVFIGQGTALNFGTAVSVRRDRTMGWADKSIDRLIAAETFHAKFKVTPTLAGTTTMGGTITEDINLNGSLTFNFAFGL